MAGDGWVTAALYVPGERSLWDFVPSLVINYHVETKPPAPPVSGRGEDWPLRGALIVLVLKTRFDVVSVKILLREIVKKSA